MFEDASLFIDALAAGVAAGALVVGILALRRHAASNRLAEDANTLANEANTRAGEANTLAGEANTRAGEANVLSGEANQIAAQATAAAQENAQAIERIRLKQERVRHFQNRHEELSRHLTNFRNELASIGSEAAADSVEPPAEGDVIRRARMVSRAFRSAMRHYGESRELFKLLKGELGSETVKEIEGQMRAAAKKFKDDFDAERLAGIVEIHGQVLTQLTDLVGDTLGDLRRQVEVAAGERDEPLDSDET